MIFKRKCSFIFTFETLKYCLELIKSARLIFTGDFLFPSSHGIQIHLSFNEIDQLIIIVLVNKLIKINTTIKLKLFN